LPFTSYASVADVSRRHSIRWRREPFVETADLALSDHFRSELAFTLSDVPFDISEAAARETLIYPILREIWKPFSKVLTLWNNQPLSYDEDLNGVPDFLVSRRSPLGTNVPDQPYLLVVEAKKDDFPRGWGQCLAAMLAAQKLGKQPDETLYGVSTNGLAWQFGLLRGDVFTQDPRPFTLKDLDELAGAIHFVMLQCRDQAARAAVTA